MWKTKSKGSSEMSTTEGDYGVQLPFEVDGITIDNGDSLKFVFKEEADGEPVLVKTYTKTNENPQIHGRYVDLSFTAAEAALFEVGKTYIYTLDWYKADVFQYCLIDDGKMKVVNHP